MNNEDNYCNRYIKIVSNIRKTIYMYVVKIWNHNNFGTIFEGLSFDYNFGENPDDIYFDYCQHKQLRLNTMGFNYTIEIITKDEFNKAFRNGIENAEFTYNEIINPSIPAELDF